MRVLQCAPTRCRPGNGPDDAERATGDVLVLAPEVHHHEDEAEHSEGRTHQHHHLQHHERRGETLRGD